MAVQTECYTTPERKSNTSKFTPTSGSPVIDGATGRVGTEKGAVGSVPTENYQDVTSKPPKEPALARADVEMNEAEQPFVGTGTFMVDDSTGEEAAPSPCSSASSSAPAQIATKDHVRDEDIYMTGGVERVPQGGVLKGGGQLSDGTAAEQHVVVNATMAFGRSTQRHPLVATPTPLPLPPPQKTENPDPERKLPAQFDPSTCRTLYVGNLHPFINESILKDVFSALVPVDEVKIIKDKQSGLSAGYGFVKLADHGSAERALASIHNAHLYGQEIRLNWAFQSNHRDDPSGQSHVFVGDLSNDVTDQVLFAAFAKISPDCVEARVMWDHQTGRSKGYGFVSFQSQSAAEAALNQMNGESLGGRNIRVGWAQHKQDATSTQDANEVNKTDPTNTNVYVGCLSPEVTDTELRRHFSAFGNILELKQHRKGGYAFVRYHTHEAAVGAICGMTGKVLGGKTLKCSWGRNVNIASSGVSPVVTTGLGSNPVAGGAVMLDMGAMQPTAPLVNSHLPNMMSVAQQMMMCQQHGILQQQQGLLQALLLAQQVGQGVPMATEVQMLMQQQMQGLANPNGIMGMQQHASGLMPMDQDNMYYGMYQ